MLAVSVLSIVTVAGIVGSVLANDSGPRFPSLSSKDACTSLLGGTNVSVIFTADPGLEHGGIGENYYLLRQLKDGKKVTFPACFSAEHGILGSSRVALITTGEGPSTAEVCVFQVLACSEYIKETMFFGTAGFSPRQGGILNPPSSCSPPEKQGVLLRFGDICITNHAINWDCQGGPWSNTAMNWPDECTLAGSPDAPFEDVLQSRSSASYRGWDCVIQEPDDSSKQLADELVSAQNATQAVAPAPEGVQEYLQWFWGNTTELINRTWVIDSAAAPRVFDRQTCAEVDSVFWWTGVPWDTQARGFVSNAVGGSPNTTETVAASAMEGIGYMSALRMARNISGIIIPYAILRSVSDFTVDIPVYQAANGTWLPGAPVALPPQLAETGDEGGAPVTIYAIQSGNALIGGMFEQRCVKEGYTAEQCSQGVSIRAEDIAATGISNNVASSSTKSAIVARNICTVSAFLLFILNSLILI